VAASGTYKTKKPLSCKAEVRDARAVVLPAQGPPVRQILNIGTLQFSSAFG